VPVGSPHGKEVPVQELQYFCIKDKGYHVSVWPKDQGIQGVDYLEFNIAGIKHGDNVDDHLGEFAATLEPEPTNPYDPNAIKILARNGDRVGYVPKDIISNVRAFTQLPCKCYCYIWKNNEICYSCCYISKDECEIIPINTRRESVIYLDRLPYLDINALHKNNKNNP
jgi:hypothetical protein